MSETTNGWAIETQQLGKSYNGFDALKNFSMKVPKKSIFAFLGPNGAGKTTTIRILLGLLRPTAGTGTVMGYNILTENQKLRSRVGYLAQDPRFYSKMSARQTLRFIARFYYRGYKSLVEERIEETLQLVGLSDKADRSIKGFSGGEMQRLGIAQAQISHPDILILDEPAAGLDPQGRITVLKVMEELREYATVFYSTHILDDVQKVSDEVAIINHGQLIAQAPIKELLSGQGQTTYSIQIKGDASQAFTHVNNQKWVASIQTKPENGRTRWQVSVTDEAMAEDQLLPLLVEDKQVRVTEFKQREYDLEEIFIRLVEGTNND